MAKIRWGIFAFYDVQGIAGKYIVNYLDSMSKFLSRIVIVCNCELNSNSKAIFHKYTDEIIIRKNIGGDAGAYKYVILNYFEKNEILEIDELILFNDTMFGPFTDMEIIFHKMESLAVQFWGITQNNDAYLPSHIQSYFIGIKKEILKSTIFIKFWENLNVETNDMKVIVYNFEIMFTLYFQNAGFSWETLAGKTKEYLYTTPFSFLEEKSIPFVKKKSFGLHGMPQSESEKVVSFIKNNTNYPMEFIYDEIHRKYERNVFNGYFLYDGYEKKKQPKYNLEMILKFLEPYNRIFIFGTTIYGICLAGFLVNKYVEFVVSDNYYIDNKINGIKISRLSEIKEDFQTCMVVTAKSDRIGYLTDWKNVLFYW